MQQPVLITTTLGKLKYLYKQQRGTALHYRQFQYTRNATCPYKMHTQGLVCEAVIQTHSSRTK
eukprot:4343462-Pleurochrysis_carterae.AAC.7